MIYSIGGDDAHHFTITPQHRDVYMTMKLTVIINSVLDIDTDLENTTW